METLRSDDGTEIALSHLAGSGEEIVLVVHATGFLASVYQPLAAHLARSGRFSIWGVDLRAHGYSGLPPGPAMEWEAFGQDVAAAARRLGGDGPIHGIGHSCGGAALLLGELSGTAFRSLFLYEPIVTSPSSRSVSPPGVSLEELTLRRRSDFASREDALRNFTTKPPMDSFLPEVSRLYVEHGFRETAEGITLRCPREYEADTYRHAPLHSAWERLHLIRCPTFILRGEQSNVFDSDHFRAMADRLTAGGYLEVEGAGHFAPFEDPSSLSRLFASWIARLGA